MAKKYMKIIVQKEVRIKIQNKLNKSRSNESKGACFAFRMSNDCYLIEDVFISKEKGTFCFSNLKINFRYKRFEKNYFRKHNFDYLNHNYIGDWHSHPSFECKPSNYDKKEAFEELKKSNANFLIQLILKMDKGQLVGRCFLYQEHIKVKECDLVIQ